MRSISSGTIRRAAHRRAGYTMMELMVTMAIAAVLMGFGIGAFLTIGKTTAYRQSIQDAAGLVNKCRNASSRFPAALVADAENGILYGRTEQVLQELHFEPIEGPDGLISTHDGINGLLVTMHGEVLPDGGRVGGGFSPSGGIDCGNPAAYDVRDGVSFELWINPERLAASTLVRKGDMFDVELRMGPNRPGSIKVTLGIDDKGVTEDVELTAETPVIREYEWVGIHVSYDRDNLTISTDHGYGPVVRGQRAETRPLKTDPDANLHVAETFSGVIDDFRFGGVTVDDPLQLPNGVAIDGASRTIYFRDGRLDPRRHQGVEELRIAGPGTIAVIEIGRSGTVQAFRETQTAQAVDGSGGDGEDGGDAIGGVDGRDGADGADSGE